MNDTTHIEVETMPRNGEGGGCSSALIGSGTVEPLQDFCQVISLGAGVQSTTMALMSLFGELPQCEHWIFADTGEEPNEVYDHLRKLKAVAEQHGVKVHTTETVPLSVAMFVEGAIPAAGKNSYVSIPTFGQKTYQQRQCTKYLKVLPIRRLARTMAKRVEMWIGISTDEAHRMKPSGLKWLQHDWPLIEKRMSRGNCHEWLKRQGWSAPKSACTFCPYHSDAVWRELKAGPHWERIVAIDRQLNEREEYLHKKLLPIDEVDFSTDSERGQAQINFGNECEGMCGV